MNGNTEGDKEGKLTYIGARGKSVIDYVLTYAETRGKIDKLIIEDRTELDHMPICVYLQIENESKAVEDNLRHNIQMQQIGTEESIKKYTELLEDSQPESESYQLDQEEE